MKKTLFFMLMIAFAITAQSQVEFKLGVKAGINISKVDVKESIIGYETVKSSELTSGHAGLFARIKVLGKLAVQPEFLYSMQGSVQEFKLGNIYSNEKSLKTRYFEVPIMLKFYPLAGLNIQAGPEFGFLSEAKLDGEAVKRNLNKSSVSVNVGLGYDLPFGLGVDARYNIGMTEIYKDYKGQGSNKQNMYTFSLSYAF